MALQRDLQALDFLPASSPLDGVHGLATRAAFAAWQRAQDETATGTLSDADAAALDQQAAAGTGAIATAEYGTAMAPIAEQPVSPPQAVQELQPQAAMGDSSSGGAAGFAILLRRVRLRPG